MGASLIMVIGVKIAIEVVGNVREYRRIDREFAGMRHQQRVAVGRRL